jgi:allantoinase
VMNISVHPNIFGQPFRLRNLRKALQHCLEHAHKDRIWLARPCEIADHCLSLPTGTIPGG